MGEGTFSCFVFIFAAECALHPQILYISFICKMVTEPQIQHLIQLFFTDFKKCYSVQIWICEGLINCDEK